MMFVMELLEAHEQVEFMRIFESSEPSGVPSRGLLVATFLAVLELARLTALCLYQGIGERGAPDGPIRVRRANLDPEQKSWRQQVAETM